MVVVKITVFLLFALLYTACSSEKSSSWQLALNLEDFSLLQDKQPLFVGNNFYYASDSMLFIHNITNGNVVQTQRLTYHNPSSIISVNNGLVLSYPYQEQTILELRSLLDGHLIKEINLPISIKSIYPNSDNSHVLLIYIDNSALGPLLQASLYNLDKETKSWTINNLPLVHQPSFSNEYIYWLGVRDTVIAVHQKTGKSVTSPRSNVPKYIALSQYTLSSKQRATWRIWDTHDKQLMNQYWDNYTPINGVPLLTNKQDSTATIVEDTLHQIILPHAISQISPLSPPNKRKILFTAVENKTIHCYDLDTKKTKKHVLDYSINETSYFSPFIYYNNTVFYTTIMNGQYYLIGEALVL